MASMEKAWLMAPMEYNRNGKGIMAPRMYILIIYSPIKKAWFYERLFLELVMAMVKEKNAA